MLKLWCLRPHDRLRDDERPDYDENPTTNPWEPWYDKTFGFVVRAETENDARQLAHDNQGDEGRNASPAGSGPWLERRYSTCVELTADGEAGVIIRDFMSA